MKKTKKSTKAIRLEHYPERGPTTGTGGAVSFGVDPGIQTLATTLGLVVAYQQKITDMLHVC